MDLNPAILVVEDEPLTLLIAGDALERRGYRVVSAVGGEEALETLRSRADIRILFTDIHLIDELSGLDLAKEARRIRPGIQVLYTSGQTRRLPQEVRVPGAGFLPKPYRLADLLSAVAMLVYAGTVSIALH